MTLFVGLFIAQIVVSVFALLRECGSKANHDNRFEAEKLDLRS